MDQVASLGVVRVFKSNSVCVCVPVSVRVLAQLRAGTAQTRLQAIPEGQGNDVLRNAAPPGGGGVLAHA